MSAKGKVARNKNGSRSARHGRESDHVCSSLTSPPTAGSSFKACGHNLAGAASSCGPPGDGKPLDLTQLSSEQRSKLESFLKTSGFGPLPKAGQTLDAATMRKLAHHMRAAAALPSKSSIRNWADTEKNPKDGLVRQAVSSSKRDDVKNLLEEGGDVDEVEPKTLCTPLMLAVRDGSKEIVQILLDYDADVTRRDKDGRTAIMEACAAGRDDLVQLLIDHGSCVADTDNSNWNSLTHCAANGHVRSANVVMRHLKYDKDSQEKLKEIVKKEDKIKKKDPKAASTAKVVSPDLDDYDDAECPAESALATAAHKGQFEFVKFYLSHKDQFHVTETELQAACSKACYSKRLDLLRFLIEEHGAKVNPESPIAETPLCSASASGDLDMVRYLLQRGARVNDYDGNGFSPLMRACNEGHAAIIPVLLQHGANVNAQNSQYENWTPLCFAILKSNMEIVQSLVTAHANVNLGGTAPLLLAVSFNNMQIVEYLLAHGSNPTQKSQHGDAAINFAADVGNLEWVKRFHTLGCDVDCVGDKGQTPLMKAAKKGSLEVVEYLLDNGASINRVSLSNDSSALSQACSKGWIKIIEFLLERGANRHIKLKDGVTPLLEAVKSGNAEAADLVLYYQPKNAEFRESSGGHRGHTCDHLGDVGSHIKAAMTPMKEFYLNMNYSCKHCDGHHGEPARTTSEHSSDDEEIDEEDGEDGDEDEDSEDHIGCEDDEEEEDPEECESGEEEEELDDPNYTSDEDESGDDEQDKKDFIADSENFELPEIYPDDLEKLGFSATDSYSVKEGLDADIDFIRTQLSHFQPQSFEFRILNAMLRKAEQLQKSLPHHTPEELRRRFSEEISRWQTELQSNANVDDLMDKLVTEPADDETLEGDEPGLADIAAFLQANPTVLDYPSLLMQRTDVYPGGEPAAGSVDSATAVSLNKDGKPGLTLSPDGKYIIMTNSGNSNFQAPLNEFEFLRSIAAAADANAASGGSLVNGIEHLPEELAKVMADARKHGVFNMESFSNFFQGAREDPQFLEDYRNAIRVPASFNFSSSTPPASLAPIPTVGVYGAAPPAAARKPSSAAAGAKADVMPKLESRRHDKVKAPRTPEPTPDDTSEEGFEGSDDVPSLEVKPPIFKPEGRSAKKTIRSTRDVATNVTNSAAPPAKKPALVDVDQQQESDSSTALIHAAIRGNAKMIATLCDAGAKPNHKDKKGWTALGYAVERGYKEAVKELCEHGAELDVVMDTNQAKRDSSLTIACYNGRAEIVRILLDFKASTKDYTGLIEHRNSNDYTPLCVACLNGHHRVAQMLIQRGADINAR
ncbi:Ankyrin repeat and KH domain-containing protein 1 [Hypsibius exemplaris]|uniref:Ankyrin repeat and KH domain-containing protein 1 n=1 Tax=Hypsibius exemplaris TaxID=2072580 RepID=A0A1W0XB77_HYPEX|nr:Ankyrin repeat and KH domain-containing protein 1 [Hypsibius exemplaris]